MMCAVYAVRGMLLSLLLSLLLLEDALRRSCVDLAGDDGRLLHALDLGLSDHGSLTSRTLSGLLNVATHLAQIIVAHNRAVYI